MEIILGYWTFSNCTETHPVPLEGHVFDKEDNRKKPAAVTISPFSLTPGCNVNFLEDTFFHHSFVLQSIEEGRDQVGALFQSCLKPRRLTLLACDRCSAVSCGAGLQSRASEKEWKAKRRTRQMKNLGLMNERVGREKNQGKRVEKLQKGCS